ERGADVVVAGVQTRGRPVTAGLLAGLEIIPPAACGGAACGEMDLAAVLARGPQVALVDELAALRSRTRIRCRVIRGSSGTDVHIITHPPGTARRRRRL